MKITRVASFISLLSYIFWWDDTSHTASLQWKIYNMYVIHKDLYSWSCLLFHHSLSSFSFQVQRSPFQYSKHEQIWLIPFTIMRSQNVFGWFRLGHSLHEMRGCFVVNPTRVQNRQCIHLQHMYRKIKTIFPTSCLVTTHDNVSALKLYPILIAFWCSGVPFLLPFFPFTRLLPRCARRETQLKLSYRPIAVSGRD